MCDLSDPYRRAEMLKSIDKNTLNLTILTLVVAILLCCSISSFVFSVFYILICGAVGLVVFFLRKIRKGDGKNVMIYLRLF